MTFLYPTFLFALFALCIPIIIHFFNLQKPKEVLFTNVKFLKHIQEITSSKIKIKHWLVLLARLLVLLFLILAFAQPVLVDKEFSALKNTNAVAIYMDNSLSMSSRLDGNNAFDLGLQYINELSHFFKASTSYMLLSNDFESKDLVFRNSEKFRERVTELDYSSKHRSISDIELRFKSLFKSSEEITSSVFFVSDFQKSTTGDLSKVQLDSSLQYYFFPIENLSSSNLYIDSVWLDDPLIRLNSLVKLKTRVQNASNESITDVGLKLYLNDVQSSSANVSLDAGGSTVVDFSFSINDTLTQKGIVEIEDNNLTFDNKYYFALDVSNKIRVYHIYQELSSSIPNVFGNQNIFDLSSTAVGNINYSDWGVYDLIVLDAIDDVKEPLLLALKTYLQDGGAVVLVSGKKPNLITYSNLVNRMAFSSVDISSEDKQGFAMDKPDIQNPFFKDVFERDEQNLLLPYAYPTVKPAYRGNKVLSLKNSLSFLSSYQVLERGNVFLFSSPFDSEYTNFTKHSLFVPVMYKIAFSSFRNYPHLAYSFDQKLIEIPIDGEDEKTIFTLEQDDFKIIPQQTKSNDALVFELQSHGLGSGFYNLKGKHSTKILAFNTGHAESLMDFYSKDELKALFKEYKNVQVIEASDFDEFKSTFKNQYIGTPLWKYCLILALFFLLSEILVLRFL